MAPHDEEAYAPVNMADHDHDHDDHHMAGPHYGSGGISGGRSDYSDPYGPAGGSQVGAGSTVSSYHDNPFRQQDGNPFDNDTEYHSGRVSAAGGGRASAAGGRYAPPTATDAFDDASFPHANYDRIER
jgi:hypothetical protein